ncbi:hypothetical protein KIH74_21860 [Kineosporia sp. J2-2]|uniref:Rod shape-determining protein MreD n=1 Tax=Kineosporia corallincola TaxID=2835133 RepID=A0ABS5TKH4_9ACTN|nr:hypothetical protein [Kineosporia corallincola]MBT0771600.1 hypothetical protein [Kineosporia corallincola]
MARLITDALAPAHLVLVTVLVVACAQAGPVAGTGWAALDLLFVPACLGALGG